MKPRHLLLALVIVFFWGVNFAIIKLGLRQISPLGLGVIRFVLAAFPWIFFIRRPPIPLASLALYSLLIFALQFGFLFTGMKVGVSAGLASLVMQLQVFFTIGFAVLFLAERPTRWQLLGALFAFGGIGVVAANLGGDVTLAGLSLLILGAMAWGGGNIVSRVISMRHGAINVLGLVCWGSLFAAPPLLAVALILDPQGLAASFAGLDWTSLGAIAYLVYISTLFCFGAWSLLLALYPVATVAPFTLLVPVFGFLGSAALLGEAIQPWKLLASALIIAGLILNVFGQRLFR
ncbi:EamA family transporter [Bosea sp. (in: a-proteobacteria)]|jgi:O-acetylserine/cysteine efflux transporter|uniref:EamA family transporter n=1 Tax=Bosea sp. (in: a-proteobacteria) TaxID=1871050 RepID=UPI002DDD9E3F|nr:EamA family transporter [Bosea sp. (in: a-proteobacteria)]HEV2512233.1 EamA family transporter [Bosea sp. (in: a-proteobacteria)]